MLNAVGVLFGTVFLLAATCVSLYVGGLMDKYDVRSPDLKQRSSILFFIHLWLFLFITGLLLVTRII